MSGTFTFASGCDFCLVKNIRVTGNITLDTGTSGIQFTEFWKAAASSVTDNSTGSFIQGMEY